MKPLQLHDIAAQLDLPWHSRIVGQAGASQVKVLRMDQRSYPTETHAYDEALLVLSGCMMLEIDGTVVPVQAGEIYFVSAGKAHAVAPGSQDNLLIIDTVSA